jgi:rhamnogalacturonyl hydrolase YesR
MHETAFEFQSVPLKPTLDIQVLDFGSVFGPASGGVAFAMSSIRTESDTMMAFGLSRDLPLTIRLNGATVYSANEPSSFVFHEIGYELFRFNDTIRLPLKRGNNLILIKAGLSAGRNVAYLRELARPGVKPSTSFDLAPVDPAFKGKPWTFIGVFVNTRGNPLAESLPPESGYKSTYSHGGADFSWRFPAQQQMVKELRIQSDATYRRESYAEWQYPNGTVMLSLLDFAAEMKDTLTAGFVKRFCDFTLDNLELFRKQYEQLHAFRGTNHKLIRRGMLDDTGAPALPFVELYRRTRNRRLEPLVADIAQYIRNGQVRLPDGTLCRYERMPGTVWADDLFMSAPYLMRMGVVTGDKQYFDDAAQQVVNFNKYLVETRTGLYRHGWYDAEKRQSPVAWGRANGWVIWATSEILELLPTSHPLRDKIVNIYRDHLKAVVTFQAPSGLWHQVLDRPDSFEETSCTAMFMIGIVRGIRLGILDASYVPHVKKAWSGLQTRISEDGIVKDICRGTEMSDDLGYYFKRERFDNDPRGLGAVITACTEMVQFENPEKTK